MTEKEANNKDLTINENYGGGCIVENYSGKIGTFGAAFAGKEELGKREWRSQPLISQPFKDKEEALKACDELIEITDCL